MPRKTAPASTADALIAKYGKARPKGPRCGVSTTPRESLIEELAAAGMAYEQISYTVRQEYGDRILGVTISRHMRGMCSCPAK